MGHVSKCCGRKYTMRVIRTVVYASGETVTLQSPGMPLEETPVCCGCREPCRIVPKGEETKPYEGGVYCQGCARRMTRSERIPEGLQLRHPASHNGRKTTCWGCGKTVKFREASEIVRKK